MRLKNSLRKIGRMLFQAGHRKERETTKIFFIDTKIEDCFL